MSKDLDTIISETNDMISAGIAATLSDSVNHPPHYTFGRYEVIDVLLDWFPDDPLLWQVGKYIARAERKGNELEDLRKAAFYLNRRITRLEAGQSR